MATWGQRGRGGVVRGLAPWGGRGRPGAAGARGRGAAGGGGAGPVATVRMGGRGGPARAARARPGAPGTHLLGSLPVDGLPHGPVGAVAQLLDDLVAIHDHGESAASAMPILRCGATRGTGPALTNCPGQAAGKARDRGALGGGGGERAESTTNFVTGDATAWGTTPVGASSPPPAGSGVAFGWEVVRGGSPRAPPHFHDARSDLHRQALHPRATSSWSTGTSGVSPRRGPPPGPRPFLARHCEESGGCVGPGGRLTLDDGAFRALESIFYSSTRRAIALQPTGDSGSDSDVVASSGRYRAEGVEPPPLQWEAKDFGTSTRPPA